MILQMMNFIKKHGIKLIKKMLKKNDIGRIRTCAGKPNGFQVHRLNHSATMSSQNTLLFFPIKII